MLTLIRQVWCRAYASAVLISSQVMLMLLCCRPQVEQQGSRHRHTNFSRHQCYLQGQSKHKLLSPLKFLVYMSTEAEIGLMWLHIKECWQPPEAPRSKKYIYMYKSPLESPLEPGPSHTLSVNWYLRIFISNKFTGDDDIVDFRTTLCTLPFQAIFLGRYYH